MAKTSEFVNTMSAVAEAVYNRTADMEIVKNAPVEPTLFYLVHRDGELHCVYVKNIAPEEVRLVRIDKPQRGFTYDEWERITRKYIKACKEQAERSQSCPPSPSKSKA